MTPDIVKLRESIPTLESIIERLELELVDDPSWGEPSDTSYLTLADRQNPDIAANVDAMAATNKLIAWFGRDAEGYLGLWRGPTERSLDEAPVVRLDSEGQYSIVAATVPDYLAIAMPEDEFAATRDVLARAGFKVGFNPDAIWGALDAFDDDPNAYRNELYEQYREQRGLPRTDADSENPDVTEEVDVTGVPQPQDFASGSQPAMPVADDDDDDDELADGDDDDIAAHAHDADKDGGDTQETRPAKPAKVKAAPAKKPAAKAAPAKKPAVKAAPAKKAPAKAAAKAAKKPAAAAKKAAAKPAKPGKKSAAKPAAKKAAAKPAKKKR